TATAVPTSSPQMTVTSGAYGDSPPSASSAGPSLPPMTAPRTKPAGDTRAADRHAGLGGVRGGGDPGSERHGARHRSGVRRRVGAAGLPLHVRADLPRLRAPLLPRGVHHRLRARGDDGHGETRRGGRGIRGPLPWGDRGPPPPPRCGAPARAT